MCFMIISCRVLQEQLNKLLEIQNKVVGRYEIIKPGRVSIIGLLWGTLWSGGGGVG